MKTSIVGVFAVAVLLTSAVPAHAAALTEGQIQAILSLLSSFGADATVVTNVDASLRGKAVSAVATSPSATPTDRCLFVKTLTRTLSEGLSDSETAGEVTALQKFLAADSAVYPEGKVTGYFGPATERAVERWQVANGVVSSGSPETTGYGVVGNLTRTTLLKKCGYAANTPAPLSPKPTSSTAGTSKPSILSAGEIKVVAPENMTVSVGTKITVKYIVGANIYAGDPAIIERSIVNANTGAVVSGYVPVTQSSGSYTFDWIPSESGTYQALVRITLDTTQYPARSGVITVTGNPLSVSNLPIPTVTVNVSPPVIPLGQISTVFWTATNANRCILRYGTTEEKVEVNGSKTVTPLENTLYLVWCTYDPGDGKDGPSASATVTLYTTSTYN